MHSDFLYARPSFMEGLARIMDFGNTLNEYNTSPADEEADFTAICVDWYRIGQDLHDAIGQFEVEHAKESDAVKIRQ